MKIPNVFLWTLCVAMMAISTMAMAEPVTEPVKEQLAAGTKSTKPANLTEVTVHVLERYLPFDSKIVVTVGAAYDAGAGTDYQLVTSFSAYEYSQHVNAPPMDCYAAASDTNKWTPMLDLAGASTGGAYFCLVRDSVPADDAASFAVAQFQRVNATGRLVLAAQAPMETLLQQAKARGWTEPPLVAFRVAQLKQWQAAPLLTFVSDLHTISIDDSSKAADFCPSDPNGIMTRKLEGGNFYAGRTTTKLVLLCVSYVQRSLHDLNHEETFVTDLRLEDGKKCQHDSKSVKDVVVSGPALLRWNRKGRHLICYRKRSLLLTNKTLVAPTDTRQFVQLVRFDESQKDLFTRLQVVFHGKHAWDFPLQNFTMVS